MPHSGKPPALASPHLSKNFLSGDFRLDSSDINQALLSMEFVRAGEFIRPPQSLVSNNSPQRHHGEGQIIDLKSSQGPHGMFFDGVFDSCRGSTAGIAGPKNEAALNIKSLSVFTQAENTFVQDKISKLNEREARERDSFAPSRLSTVNCEELLRKAN